MKKIINACLLMSVLYSVNSMAYINCNSVPVKINATSASGFHNFNELGVVGSFLFIELSPDSCINSTNKDFALRLFMVIDDIENAKGIKKVWLSMLLSAEARNKTINFHAYDRGINSRGFQAIDPYFLQVN